MLIITMALLLHFNKAKPIILDNSSQIKRRGGFIKKHINISIKDKFNILIVEDEKDMSHIISSVLKDESYMIDKSYKGKQAIKKIKEKGYNLMILDYKLPDIDGINLLKEIRKIKPFLKVIMVSAYGTPSIKLMAKKLGAYAFLDKPFEIKKLVKVIKGALAKK